MADVKWIKICTDIVNNKKIKRIRTMPEGNNIILIWVFLIAQAGECNRNGGLFLTDAMPFTKEDLAIEFNFEIPIVQLALITLEKFSMIEVYDDIIYIKNWDEYQNCDGLEKIRAQGKERARRFREKQKQILIEGEEHICAYCGETSNTIDHIIPKSKGGADVSENVVDCCKSCNSSKSNKDLCDFLNDSLQYKNPNIDHELVRSNKKLMEHVAFLNGKYKSKRYDNVTVTDGNAIEEELELELEKDNKDICHKYGEYKKVLLSDIQLEKLKKEFSDWEERIRVLDEYIECKGKKYSNHYATIKAWDRKAKKEQAEKKIKTSDGIDGKKKLFEEWANG